MLVAEHGTGAAFLAALLDMLVHASGASGGHLYALDSSSASTLPSDARTLMVPAEAREWWRRCLGGRALMVSSESDERAPARDLLEAHEARCALLLPLALYGADAAFFALYDPASPREGELTAAVQVAVQAIDAARGGPAAVPWREVVGSVHAFSHDLRNHLSVVINQAELLIEEIEGDTVDPAIAVDGLRDVLTAARTAETQVKALAARFPRD